MTTLFLLILFLAFISLGLPDSGLGVAWPNIRGELSLPLSYLGGINIITTIFGALSSILAIRLARKYSSGLIVAISALLTGLAMLGFAYTQHYYFFLFLAIPLGFGAGGVDASINDYVSKYYSNRIMNWLHASWGIGSTISPLIMTFAITSLSGWRDGFRIIAITQLLLVIVFFASLKMWKNNNEDNKQQNGHETKNPIYLKTCVLLSILTFFLYAGAENTLGSWLKSYLVEIHKMDALFGGVIVSVYFGSIMTGRILAGFVSKFFGNRRMISMGISLAFVGVLLFFVKNEITMIIAVFLIGIGFAPIFPSLMHETPSRYASNYASKVISYQMAFSNIAMLVISPLFGVLAQFTSLRYLTVYLLVLISTFIIVNLYLNKLTKVYS